MPSGVSSPTTSIWGQLAEYFFSEPENNGKHAPIWAKISGGLVCLALAKQFGRFLSLVVYHSLRRGPGRRYRNEAEVREEKATRRNPSREVREEWWTRPM